MSDKLLKELEEIKKKKRPYCRKCGEPLHPSRSTFSMEESEKRFKYKAAAFYHDFCWHIKIKEMEEIAKTLLYKRKK